MSKIFEALHRATLGAPGLNLPGKLAEDAAETTVEEKSAPAPPPPQEEAPAAERAKAAEGYQRELPIRLHSGAPVLPYDGSDPYTGEQYRIVRTKLIQHPRQPRLCLISSPGPRDGKTITAINLAAAMALRSEATVALVDADMRRPSIATLLGLPESPGLADVLAGSCGMEDVWIKIEQLRNIYLIPAGKAQVNPTELLDAERWREVCAGLRRQFRFTIMDAPPIIGVADYALIQAHVDGVIVVVRPDHTNRGLCFKALEAIPKEKMIGITVNCAPEWFLLKHQRHHSYYYYEHAGLEPGNRAAASKRKSWR